MLKAVLFDLDGTLLDIDLGRFLSEYFDLLGPAVAVATGLPAEQALSAVLAGTEAMHDPHVGRTNQTVFEERFAQVTGVDISSAAVAEALARFYAEDFPSLREGHGPQSDSRQAYAAARDAGLLVALATNPIFPAAAIHERARWAGFQPEEFDVITSYETAEACKPYPHYFRQVAADLRVTPGECLMVGDDPSLDLAAGDVGMRTFFVSDAPTAAADWTGSLADLPDLISRLG